MPLSKFWPNKTLLWKDWRLTLPVFLIWTSFVTFISTLTFVYHLVSYRAGGWAWTGEYWHGFREVYRLLESSGGLAGNAMVMLAIGLGAVSLGLERQRGTLSLLVSMPYARREIFLSKTLVGLGQIGLPFIANAVLMTLLLWANRGVNFPFDANTIWSWAVHSVLVLTFVLCITLLASTVSGKGAAFLALVLLFFPIGMNMLVEMNAMQWEVAGLVSRGQGLYRYWSDLALDAAMYLTVPTWLIDFPSVVAANSTAFVEGNVVEWDFANRVWAFLREHTYILYLGLVGLSLGAYALAQRWFARNQLEFDGELLVLPSLRPLIATGFTVCSAMLGGAVLPALFRSGGSMQLAVILLSYAGSAAMAWMLVTRFLHPSEGTREKSTTTLLAMPLTTLLLIGVVSVAIVLVATLGMPMFGGPGQLSDAQVVPLMALAEAVMERRTAALVVDDAAPLVALSNELAYESPELFSREQALIAKLAAHREALRQQGETYIRSETNLVFVSFGVAQNTATIVAVERGKLYYAAVLPGQPEYMAWEAERVFVFVKQDAVWELTEIGVVGKGLPPNEPGGQ